MARETEFGRYCGMIFEPDRDEIAEITLHNPIDWRACRAWLNESQNLGEWDIGYGVNTTIFYISDPHTAFEFKMRFG